MNIIVFMIVVFASITTTIVVTTILTHLSYKQECEKYDVEFIRDYFESLIFEETEKIRRFQYENNIMIDGKIGYQTMKLLILKGDDFLSEFTRNDDVYKYVKIKTLEKMNMYRKKYKEMVANEKENI